MKSIEAAISYPRERDDWVRTILVGGLLLFLSFLVVPLFAVYGYLVRAVRGTLADDPRPPAFDDWEDLIVEGVKAWAITVVYTAIPLVVGGLTVGGAVVSFLLSGDVGATLGTLALGLSVTFVLFLIFGYVAAAALVNFAAEERFGAAFEFGTIRTVVLSREFALAWVVTVGLFLLVGFLTAFANAIPVVGLILGSVVSFYASVVAATLWASGYGDVAPVRDGVSRSGRSESAI